MILLNTMGKGGLLKQPYWRAADFDCKKILGTDANALDCGNWLQLWCGTHTRTVHPLHCGAQHQILFIFGAGPHFSQCRELFCCCVPCSLALIG